MRVTMEQVPPIPVGNYDSQYEAKIKIRNESDDSMLGELRVSAGGIAWRQANAHQENWLSWNDFSQLMEGATS